MSLKEFAGKLAKDDIDRELVKTIFDSIFTSVIVIALLYFLKLKNVFDFTDKYGFFLFFAILSYSLIISAVRQVKVYHEFPCMSGMMIGMTMGMIASFLTGFYVASTNGMFIGGFFGVAVGITLGIWNGKCCGVMGSMEGIMAGFMGGLMGAMTAFMLLNDHLKIAGVLVFAISAVIMIKLNYMIFTETKESERQEQEDHFFTVALTFILIALTAWLIVFGPRGGIFQ